MNKISIVMPVYNSESYLAKCLQSLAVQTFKDFEIICINDGSTDNSLQILYEFKERFKDSMRIVSQENKGAGAARNIGFELVTSPTVLFLDSDDYFYPDFLEKMYKKYLETNANIVICRYNVIFPDGKIYQQGAGIKQQMLPEKEVFSKRDIPEYLFNFSNPAVWNKLINVDFIKRYGLKFENVKVSNDVYFVLASLFFAGSIAVVDEILIEYNYLNNNSITVCRKNNINVSVSILETCKKLAELCNDNNALKISLYNAWISSVMYQFDFLKGKQRRQFINLIKQNIPLYSCSEVYKPYLYNRLLLIKYLPVDVFIFLYKLKCVIKRLLFLKKNSF